MVYMEEFEVRVLFICKKRLVYGQNVNITSFGLINSANLVCESLSKLGITCKTIMVNDANDIDREVTKYNPSHVVLEALWVTPDKMKEIVMLHTRRKWIVRIHSKIPFLSHEGIAIDWIHVFSKHHFLKNHVEIACNSRQVQHDLEHLLKTHVSLLPNTYPVDWEVTTPPPPSDNVINIGCFGSIRPLKNTFIQAVAAIKFAEKIGMKLQFHVNGKTEQHADGILHNLRNLFKHQNGKHILVEHPWYPYEDFIKVVRTMNLGMQVSYSETFNIVIADFVNNNLPVVVSDEIRYLPWYTKASPNSVDDIYNRLRLVWRLRNFGETFINKLYLNHYSDKSEYRWLHELKRKER